MGRNYLKLWTDALDDPWFVGLSLTEVGVWTKLLLLAKNGADNGRIVCKSTTDLTNLVSGNRRTVRRVLVKMHNDGKIRFTRGERFVEVEILKYQYWQGLRVGQVRKERAKVGQNEGKNAHDVPTLGDTPDQTRPDKTRPDQIREELDSEAESYYRKDERGKKEEQDPNQIKNLNLNEATKNLRLPLSPSEQREIEKKKIRSDTIGFLKVELADHFAGKEIPKGGYGTIAGWLYKIFSAYDPAIKPEEIMWIVVNKFPNAKKLGELYSHVNKIKGKLSADLLGYAVEARRFVNASETRKRSDKEGVN